MNLAISNRSLVISPRCTRARYVAMAVLLGPLGVHNFVAGYRFRALIQLGLSVASMGLLSPVSAVWALLEAWAVRVDGDGVTFGPSAALSIKEQSVERVAQAEPTTQRRAA